MLRATTACTFSTSERQKVVRTCSAFTILTGAISATPATQSEGGCHQVPRLPRKVKVDVACHAKSRSMRPSATPGTQSEGRCHQVPCLPRKVTVDVTKYHACHAKCRGDHGGKREPSASPEPAQCHKCHACHAK